MIIGEPQNQGSGSISTASFGRLSKLAEEQIVVILGIIQVIESHYVMLYRPDWQDNR